MYIVASTCTVEILPAPLLGRKSRPDTKPAGSRGLDRRFVASAYQPNKLKNQSISRLSTPPAPPTSTAFVRKTMPKATEIPFQSNGNRYVVEQAASGRSHCKSCSGVIQKGALRFGSSGQNTFGGSFFWTHLECTKNGKIGNLHKCYGISTSSNDYSSVPGFNELTSSQRTTVTEHFSGMLKGTKKAKTVSALEQAAAEAARKEKRRANKIAKDASEAAKAKKKARRTVAIAEYDWRTELEAGDLDNETAKFLRELCRHLSLELTGKQSALLARLKEHAKKENEDSGEEEDEDDGDTYLDVRVAKTFDKEIFLGTISEYAEDSNTGEELFEVTYDDGDKEDLTREELQAAIELYDMHGDELEGTVRTREDEKENPTYEPPSLLKGQLRQTYTPEEARKLVLNGRSKQTFLDAIEVEAVVAPEIYWSAASTESSTNKQRKVEM